MKKLLAVAILAAGAALTSCSTDNAPNSALPDTSDHALAVEIATSVYHRDFDTVADKDEFVAATADNARHGCNVLHQLRDMGTLPDVPTGISNQAFEDLLTRLTRDSGLDWMSQRNQLYVNTKYRCPELSAPLGAHLAADDHVPTDR